MYRETQSIIHDTPFSNPVLKTEIYQTLELLLPRRYTCCFALFYESVGHESVGFRFYTSGFPSLLMKTRPRNLNPSQIISSKDKSNSNLQ